MLGRRFSGNTDTNSDYDYITAFVVSSRTVVGVYMPSGVKND